MDATIEKAMAIDDQPVVVDFTVGKDAMVWPMVAAGTSNDDILAARDIRPGVRRTSEGVDDDEPPPTRCRCWSRTSRACWRASPGCSAARLQHRVARRRPDRAPRDLAHHDPGQRRGSALEQVTKQLNKLINVLKIVELEQKQAVQRELLLVKVKADESTRRDVLQIVELFRPRSPTSGPRH